MHNIIPFIIASILMIHTVLVVSGRIPNWGLRSAILSVFTYLTFTQQLCQSFLLVIIDQLDLFDFTKTSTKPMNSLVHRIDGNGNVIGNTSTAVPRTPPTVRPPFPAGDAVRSPLLPSVTPGSRAPFSVNLGNVGSPASGGGGDSRSNIKPYGEVIDKWRRPGDLHDGSALDRWCEDVLRTKSISEGRNGEFNEDELIKLDYWAHKDGHETLIGKDRLELDLWRRSEGVKRDPGRIHDLRNFRLEWDQERFDHFKLRSEAARSTVYTSISAWNKPSVAVGLIVIGAVAIKAIQIARRTFGQK